MLYGQPYFLADLLRNDLVVACDDFDGNAVFSQGCNCLARCFLGRIKECDISREHQVIFVLD
jgi:hypothetical protein